METRDGREIQMSPPGRVSRAWGGGRSGKTKQPRASHLLPPCRLQPSIPLPLHLPQHCRRVDQQNIAKAGPRIPSMHSYGAARESG